MLVLKNKSAKKDFRQKEYYQRVVRFLTVYGKVEPNNIKKIRLFLISRSILKPEDSRMLIIDYGISPLLENFKGYDKLSFFVSNISPKDLGIRRPVASTDSKIQQ